jgi:endonuclease/exonuclease/phosphatase family metal-dependent hydrolase
MKILHYNILDGCENQPERLRAVQDWIAGQNADIACLCECNTWNNPPGMAAHANACGFPHAHLLVGRSRYLIALLSKSPIELLDQITTGVHHGILHGRTNGIHVICSHFSPHERLMRIHEAKTVAALVTKIGEPLVVMGDFNSASPADAGAIDLIPADRPEWASDFEPQKILLATGLLDLAARDPDHRGTLSPKWHPAAAHRWMDYIYVNDAFRKLHPALKITPVRDEQTGILSDHYPLVLTT